ncbi:MAG: nucleotide sugar dehydrogenase [Firmicutes bacterium]|nr:nucleotide sugar dehydrogenase [Bacillota bacterium]
MMIDDKVSVGVIGLGYVGAPLLYLIFSKEYDVIGIDVDTKKVENIKNKVNIPKKIKKSTLKNKEIFVTNNYSYLNDRDIIIICVPTPTINDIPDLKILNEVIENVALIMKKKCLLIIESTIAPGMTKKYVIDKLEKYNLKVNIDYDLAYCPERIDPGNSKYWVGNINRVCGATSSEALAKTCNFYKSIINAKIIPMGSIEEAELVKVWENSLRNVSIAQANLLAKICDNYNFSIKNIINGLNSKVEQFSLQISTPGLGPGGHCIPEDIHYLLDSVGDQNIIDMGLFKEAIIINEYMPEYTYNKLKKRVENNGEYLNDKKVIMLGISYKPNTDDIRRSQAIVLYDILKNNGIDIRIYDPLVNNETKGLDETLSEVEVVIIGCFHDCFRSIDYTKYKNIKYLVDCWNSYNKSDFIDSKIIYIGTGE